MKLKISDTIYLLTLHVAYLAGSFSLFSTLHVTRTLRNPSFPYFTLQMACALRNPDFSVYTLHIAHTLCCHSSTVFTLYVACTLLNDFLQWSLPCGILLLLLNCILLLLLAPEAFYCCLYIAQGSLFSEILLLVFSQCVQLTPRRIMILAVSHCI